MLSKEMEMAIENAILESLQELYYFKKEKGLFVYDLDTQDKLEDSIVIEILNEQNPMDSFYEKVEEVWFDYFMEIENEHISFITSKIEENVDMFPQGINAEIENFLIERFREMSYIQLPYEDYLNQQIRVNIMLDTGDGNYDYSLNMVYPAYEGDYDEDIDDKASIVWLAQQQGYTKQQLEKALKQEDFGNSPKFLKSLREEIANETSHMNTLCFLVQMSLKELIKLNELIKLQDKNGHIYDATERPDCGYVVIDKSTTTGLIDTWQGGGSMFDIELEKDVNLPIQFIRSALPNGGDGYSVDQIYGFIHSAWNENAIKEIVEPTTK